jgi:hypothetical protein
VAYPENKFHALNTYFRAGGLEFEPHQIHQYGSYRRYFIFQEKLHHHILVGKNPNYFIPLITTPSV